MIKLQEKSYDTKEITEILDSLNSGYITMGKKNKLFEDKWSKWIDSKYSISCNSGSSANLLIMSALRSPLLGKKIKDNDEIIVPAVSWSTTYFPIIQNNLKCRLVDIDLKTFNIDINLIKKNINRKTKAIFVVHLLGSPCNMDEIIKLCSEYNLILLEDCCESYGAYWKKKKIGTFGLASSFSFMFAHLASTSEGGMISTNEPLFNDILRIKRAHGWIRDIQNETYKNKFIKENLQTDPRFLFVDTGYNFRMDDLHSCFGIHQLDKIDNFIQKRRDNHFYLANLIKSHELNKYINILEETSKQYLAPFAFPIIAKTSELKQKLVKSLEQNGIETRGIAAGNIIRQPFMKYYKNNFIFNKLPNADILHNNGFWIGNHQGITFQDYDKVLDILRKESQ